ncbi:MAG: glycosyltransferase family 2 protein [Candidatus Hydrogenedentes bacterium]|nr:glycosyltransferase family 2 protein [Candidatus Hydrogenedentota bacterium]
MVEFSLIIPAYNEEHQIEQTLKYVREYLLSEFLSFEIVVVDDGSTDHTSDVVEKFIEEHKSKEVKLIKLPTNRGKGGAVKEAILNHTEGKVRCYYDADASTPIEEIKKLLQAINSGYDIAIASRALPESVIEVPQPYHRQFMGKIYNIMLRIFRLTKFKDTQCGCKCFTENAVKIIFPRQKLMRFSFDAEILYIAEKYGLKIIEIPTRWRNRQESRVHLLRDPIKMFLDIFRIKLYSFLGYYN